MTFISDNDKTMALKWIGLGIFLFLTCLPVMQSQNTEGHLTEKIKSEIIKSGYTINDVDELRISSMHTTPHNGLTHIYFQQYYQEIPVESAIGNAYSIEGKLHIVENALLKNIDQRLSKTNKSLISPESAVRAVLVHLHFPLQKLKLIPTRLDHYKFELTNKLISKDPMSITLQYVIRPDSLLVPAWLVEIKPSLSSDYWAINIDASSSEVLTEINYTRYCFDRERDNKGPLKQPYSEYNGSNTLTATTVSSSSYLIYPPPIESPNHGLQTLISDPSDDRASPFGWHDTDGIEGAEYLITRGNNVHSYQDTGSVNASAGDEPNGGDQLQFLFPHKQEAPLTDNIDADVTNLFYWNNFMHDWTYKFGFTESAGNFQFNNYNRGGRDRDPVQANALDGAEISNASFSSPRDGSAGEMNMYKWIIGSNIEIIGSSDVSGFYPNGVAQFGPAINTDIAGELIIASDDTDVTGDACQPIITPDISGKIAIVDRGTCQFSTKVVNVQERGAIACVICNNIDGGGVIDMGAGDQAGQVVIPSIMLSKENCQIIKEALKTQTVNANLTNLIKEFSSSFDNAVIAHEYAHGLTLRLTGGAANSSCLSNDEQAGEGWSDFFALVLTHPYPNRHNDHRGIATYLVGQEPDGNGIRRYPYSTDLSINPQTLSHVRRTRTPHQLGEVWASTLWDLYWKMVDLYGYDMSWTDPESGNYKTIQLVIDALKLQPCNPDLLESRDAIILADQINNQAAHQCLIWEVFARRGMGYDALNGTNNNRMDNKDGFDLAPQCLRTLKIYKQMSPTYSVGDEVGVTLTVRNDDIKAYSDITITEKLSPGLSYVRHTGNIIPSEINDNKIIYSIPTLNPTEEITIKYILKASNLSAPDFSYFEGFESDVSSVFYSAGDYDAQWDRTDTRSLSGEYSYKIRGAGGNGQVSFALNPVINRHFKRPGLKFWHKYDTELGADGGIIEISMDGGNSWQPIPSDYYLVNPYNETISFDLLYKSKTVAYSGKSDWQPVIIDLSAYKAQDVKVRWTYIAQDVNGELLSEGWLVDNIEVYDISEQNTEICISDNSDTLACITHLSYLNSMARTLPTAQKVADADGIFAFPNPVNQILYCSFDSESSSTFTLSIHSIDGALLRRQSIVSQGNVTHLNINVADLADGAFILAITDSNDNRLYTHKFVKF